MAGAARTRQARDVPAARRRGARYIYCVARPAAPVRFGLIGIGVRPADVYMVLAGDTAAVVSAAPAGACPRTPDNVRAHERVVEAAMRGHTVVPVSFGTIVRSDDDVVELLRSARDAIDEVLRKTEDRLEIGIDVRWDPDAAAQRIEREDETLRGLAGELGSRAGSTLFTRVHYDRLVEAHVQQLADAIRTEILAALRPAAVASRVERPPGERVLFRAAFLVARPEQPAFEERLRDVAARHRDLAFDRTPARPPYSFVTLRLGLERAGAQP